MRQVGAGEKTHGVLRYVEMLVRHVQRNREDRARAPFEAPLVVFLLPYGRRAAAGDDVYQRLEEMALRQGLAGRRDLANVSVGLLLVAHIKVAAERAHPPP